MFFIITCFLRLAHNDEPFFLLHVYYECLLSWIDSFIMCMCHYLPFTSNSALNIALCVCARACVRVFFFSFQAALRVRSNRRKNANCFKIRSQRLPCSCLKYNLSCKREAITNNFMIAFDSALMQGPLNMKMAECIKKLV
jgi:hypothetical protein